MNYCAKFGWLYAKQNECALMVETKIVPLVACSLDGGLFNPQKAFPSHSNYCVKFYSSVKQYEHTWMMERSKLSPFHGPFSRAQSAENLIN